MQVRFDSDVTASDEWIKLDNITVMASEEVDGEVQAVETVLLSEDFDDIHDTDDSAAIAHDGGWDVRGDQLVTDGHNDGILKTAAVQADGDVELSFDARVEDASKFEASGHYADNLLLQVRAVPRMVPGRHSTTSWSTMKALPLWAATLATRSPKAAAR